MGTLELTRALDNLVRTYREIPFSWWGKGCPDGEHYYNDYAAFATTDPNWWQAETDVLEIVVDADGRKWANISIVLYPLGVHTLPPALAASLEM